MPSKFLSRLALLKHHLHRAWRWQQFTGIEFQSGLGDGGWILHGLVRTMKPETCVEIGSANGHSTCLIALALRKNVCGRLWAVDPHLPNSWTDSEVRSSFTQLTANLRRLGVSDLVEIVRATTAEAAAVLPAKIDFAFIDGDHTYEGVKFDWEVIAPRMSPFGVVVFHDTLWDRNAERPEYAGTRRPGIGVPQFMEELRSNGYPIITLDRNWGLSLVQVQPGGYRFTGPDRAPGSR